MKKYLELYGKRMCMIALFYLINFGLWELIAPIISGEWASFMVYVLLFVIVLLMFHKELKDELLEIATRKLKDGRFYLRWLIVLVIDLALTMFVLWIANTYCNAILPVNNENVKNQLNAVPLAFGVIQGCVFAPIIEEMVFRYSVIGRPKRKCMWIVLTMVSIVLFDCIHIVAPLEFFYYLAPAVILTLFYDWNKNIFASILLHSSINVVGYLALLAGVL